MTFFGAMALLGSVAACSDAVPPAAQGAASFHFNSPVSGNGTCNPGSHWTSSPFNQSTATQQQVTFDNKGPIAVDGQSGAQVVCTVRPVGSKFEVTARISTPVPGAQNTSFFITTTLADLEMGASGSVTVGDDSTGGTGYSSGIANSSPPQGTCKFDSNPAGGVASGKVWARATCTDARGFGVAGSLCDFSPAGYFVFENCGTQ
jgi:hypothetical protein